MAMLSEQRRKRKWIINPTKKPLWSEDSGGIKFGKELMEKMGWSVGKGLGLNEQGIQEPLKVSFKCDTKGIGFKGNNEDWIEHQDEFNILLNQLRNDGDSPFEKGSEEEKIEFKSLEEKSKQSKARVHYQKFTRGKDLSRYSEIDLACILGLNKRKKEKAKIKQVIKTEPEPNGNLETSFGVTTINSGSLHDYFKKTWRTDKVKLSSFTETASETINNSAPDFFGEKSCDDKGIGLESKEQKSTSKKHKLESNPLYESGTLGLDKAEGIDSILDKKKRKGQEVEEKLKGKPNSRKRRKSSDCNCNLSDENFYKEFGHLLLKNENSFSAGKKRRKDKGDFNLKIAENKPELEKERKTKTNFDKYTNVLPCEEISGMNNGDSTIEIESVQKMKRQKHKRENPNENEVIEDNCGGSNEVEPVDNNTSGDMGGSECLGVQPVKCKKKTKWKLEKVKQIDNKDSSKINNDLFRRDFSDIVDMEKICDTYQTCNTFEMESGKKKKGDRKELVGLDDNENYSSQEESCCDKSKQSFKVTVKTSNRCEREDTLEMASRKKKRQKKEKFEEKRNIQCDNFSSNQVVETCSEKSNTENMAVDYEEKGALEVESVSKRKRKKDKKEISVEVESKPCREEEEVELEEAVGVEFVRRKKKRKGEKEKLGENEGIENKDEEYCQLQAAEEISVMLETDSGVIVKKSDLDKSNNEVNGLLNTSMEGKSRLQKLRTNLFPDKAADKYFPEKSTNERVVRLLRWANIAEFRGSNLRDLEGYGRRIVYEKQSR